MATGRVLCFHATTVLLLCVLLMVTCESARFGDTHASGEPVTDRLLKNRPPHHKYRLPGNPVNVNMSMTLLNIASVKPKRGEIEVVAWVDLTWTDPSLAWQDDQNTQHGSVTLPASLVWTPDVVPYSVSQPTQLLHPYTNNVVVLKDGNVIWITAQRMFLMCDVTNHRSGATCTIKMGSWTHNGYQINLRPSSQNIDLNEYNGFNYEILSTNATHHEKKYACCEESYPHIEYSFTFRNV